MDRIVIKIDDHWFDCTHYARLHPGGKSVLQKYHMKDATEAFNNVRGHVDALWRLDELVVKDTRVIDEIERSFKS